MKALAILLFASLGLNGVLLLLPSRQRDTTPSRPSAASENKSARRNHNYASAGLTASYPAAPSGNTWTELNSEDLNLLIARLRAAGFPPAALREVAFLQAQRQLAARERELTDFSFGVPYWKKPPDRRDGTNSFENYGVLDRERKALLRKALGEDYREPDEILIQYQQRRFGQLSDSKLVQVEELYSAHQQRVSKLRPSGRPITAQERDQIDAATAEYHAAARALLTPREFEEFELRSSPTTTGLRATLNHFEATEAEFLALHALRRQIDEQYGFFYGPLSPDAREARASAENEQKPRIQALLGPERYADYQQATAGDMTLNRIVARIGQPISVARAVVDLERNASTQIAAVQADSSLTPAARAERVRQLTADAEQAVTKHLGSSGFAAYKLSNPNWLQAKPTPKP